MASRYTSTSTISVPVYYSWRCQKCDEVNFSAGVVRFSAEASTTDPSRFKREYVKESAKEQVSKMWKDSMLPFVSFPSQYDPGSLELLISNSYKCTKCKETCAWKKRGVKQIVWGIFKGLTIPAFFIAILSLIFAIIGETITTAWVVFGVSAGFVVGVFLVDRVVEKKKTIRISKIPKRYLPVIGTANQEVIEYASTKGMRILTPEETISAAFNE